MCQLLGMNCNTPTDILFSFTGFRKRGGLTDNHTDGFGIAFFDNKGVFTFRDSNACMNSSIAELINTTPIKSENVIGHIRKATRGDVVLENTHPFIRELWGSYWVFAHNGTLNNLHTETVENFYTAVGNTDSENAFCYILNSLRNKFKTEPKLDLLFAEIVKLNQEISKYGTFNYILSNGQWLVSHASTLLHYKIRKSPFGIAKLVDDEVEIDFAKLTNEKDKAVVIATIPLTNNEIWQQFSVNETILFQDGDILLRDTPNPNQYLTKDQAFAEHTCTAHAS